MGFTEFNKIKPSKRQENSGLVTFILGKEMKGLKE